MIMGKDICKYHKIIKRYLQNIGIEEKDITVSNAFNRISYVLEVLDKKEEIVDRHVKEAMFTYKTGQNIYRHISTEEEKKVSQEVSLFNGDNIFLDCKIVKGYLDREYLSVEDLVAYNCFKKINNGLESECKIQELNKEMSDYVKKGNEGK